MTGKRKAGVSLEKKKRRFYRKEKRLSGGKNRGFEKKKAISCLNTVGSR